MVQPRFSIVAACLTFCLAFGCWLGGVRPALAQPAPAALPAVSSWNWQFAMGSKPLFSFSGQRPDTLGVKDGKLALCPNSPNCVSSQIPDSDAEHSIAPIAYRSSSADALAQLKSVIASMERTQIVTETADYLYAEFTSALMGYVDDVEFYFDPSQPNQIQVRSASRLGESDLGVNRKRIEAIRSQMSALDL